MKFVSLYHACPWRHKIVPSVLLALLALPVAAAEDLTIISTVTAGKKGKPITSTQYITPERVRTSDGLIDTINDLVTGQLMQIDHKKKTYWESTPEEMQAFFADLDDSVGGGLMGMIGGTANSVEVEKGTGTREVAGYTCDQYLMTLGKSFKVEVWAARGLKAPIEYHDAKKMAYATMGPMASRFDKMYEEMKKIDGFPLYTKVDTRMIGIKVKSESEATEVRKGPIPDDAFEPPAGYKKKKSPFEKKKKK